MNDYYEQNPPKEFDWTCDVVIADIAATAKVTVDTPIGRHYFYGASKRHPADRPDSVTGGLLALARALEDATNFYYGVVDDRVAQAEAVKELERQRDELRRRDEAELRRLRAEKETERSQINLGPYGIPEHYGVSERSSAGPIKYFSAGTERGRKHSENL